MKAGTFVVPAFFHDGRNHGLVAPGNFCGITRQANLDRQLAESLFANVETYRAVFCARPR
jgi:hypothetical protein